MNSNTPATTGSSGPIRPEQKKRLLTRRNFIRTSAVLGAGLVASNYVKPDFQSIKIPRAFASASEPPTTNPTNSCVPTSWKDNIDKWTALGYRPGDSFNDIFACIAFNPDRTLLEVIQSGGSGGDALGKHAVAGLLNCAAVGASQYGLSESQVKKTVRDAFNSGGIVFIITLIFIQLAKNKLESLNQSSCLIGGRLP